MPVAKIDIANLAIAHTRAQSNMTNFATDSGAIPDKIRLHYPTAVRLALADYDYSFAKKTVELATIGGSPVIPEPYTYALRIPSDYLREVLKEEIAESLAYELGADTTGWIMYTACPGSDFDFTYIWDISEYPFLFPEFFKMGVSYLLAALIAPDVVGVKGNKAQGSVDRLYNLANFWMAKAKAHDANSRGHRYNTHEGVWPRR